jgi:hypothetical protein
MTDSQFTDFNNWAEENGVPGAGAELVRADLINIWSGGGSQEQKYERIAKAVVEALEKRGRFYFNSEFRDFSSCMFFDRKLSLLRKIQSDSFLSWVSQWTNLNRAARVFRYVEKEIESAALSGPTTQGIVPEHYWATRDNAFYLSNGDGSVIRIRPNKIEQVHNGEDGVLFSCGNTLKAWKLGEPINPFEKCALFSDISSVAEHGKLLLQLWALSLPTNPKCKPPLAAIGSIGSGKTRLARGILEFYGLPECVVKATEKGEGDFWPSVHQGGIFILDNADTHIPWLPDAVAAAATGGASVKRRLYTDDETMSLRAKAWIIITSANPSFAGDAGLADRLIGLRMGSRTGSRSDSQLSEEIQAARDGGLHFVARVLSQALADTTPVTESINARHPDFGKFAIRIGRALNREADTIAALQNAEADKGRLCVETDYVGAAILALLPNHLSLEGTAAEFAASFQDHDPVAFKNITAKKVSNRFANMWSHLEAVLDVEKKTVSGGALHYSFYPKGKRPVAYGSCRRTPVAA